MTTFFLVRHGSNDWLGRGLAGHEEGVGLNEEGRAQAEWVAGRLAREEIRAIFSSPLQRSRETAEPLSRRLGLPVQMVDDLTEIRLGSWSGKSFEDLDDDPLWKRFSRFRCDTRPPGGGELSAEVQARMVRAVHSIAHDYPEACVALFGHADPMKVLLMHYLGMPLDMIFRIEISPGAITELRIGDDWAEVRLMNETMR